MKPLNSPNQVQNQEQAPEDLINNRIFQLLEYEPDLPDDNNRPYRATKTLWQRETHSKSGEHVFLSYNDHSATEHYLPPQFFIQAYGPEHSKSTPQVIDDIRWTALEDPSTALSDRMDRVEYLLNLFKTNESSDA